MLIGVIGGSGLYELAEKTEAVTFDNILKILHKNVENSKRLLSLVFSRPFPTCQSHCRELMKNAVVTPREFWPQSRHREMETILR